MKRLHAEGISFYGPFIGTLLLFGVLIVAMAQR